MKLLARVRHPAMAFVHDLVMVPTAWFGAYWLRFNLESLPAPHLAMALKLLPVVWVTQVALFWLFGLYRGVWRFASIPDLMRILKAVAAGLLIAATAGFLLTRLENVPRSVFVLDGILLVLLLGGPRFLYRWWKDQHAYRWLNDRNLTGNGAKRALIIGAGHAGELLIRDMLRNPQGPYRPIAIADDNSRMLQREIHGVRVIGCCDQIPELVVKNEIDLVLIALPLATTKEVRRIVELCERADKPFRILPRMQDLVTGQVGVKDLREVRIEDLLGREPVQLDWQAIARSSRGKTILVTGGGGSIGAEFCRQIARLEPKLLVVFERSEYNLYAIERELKERFPGLALVAVLGDVGDQVAVEKAFRSHAPEVVFHAAAYKHVPLLEGQVRAAVVNNVFGTHVVAECAHRHDCQAFVLISSDKAVNPGNVMGATKRVAEMICQAFSTRSPTRFITVRFGNVLGSSGSVIPLFQEQIARGGPVTVTHPEMTRYFMTIPEACQLILQASVIGTGGEIFVLDMGEPVRIAYLAEQMIQLSGRSTCDDIEIVYTGLRPGEKLHEELFHGAEPSKVTAHPKILLADSRALNTSVLERALAHLGDACHKADDRRIVELLLNLVPERPVVVKTPPEAVMGR